MKKRSAYSVVSPLLLLLAPLARSDRARATEAGAFVKAPCPRVHYTLVVLAIPVFLWQLCYWRPLGWRL